MPENDPDKLKGPGGLSLRHIHKQVRKSVERDAMAKKLRDSHHQPASRWQRLVRYVWDKQG